MNKPKIILIGAGGHCRSCIDVIETEGRFAIAGVVDRAASKDMTSVMEYPVIGMDEDLPNLRKQYEFAMVTVGQIKTPAVRIRLFDRLKALGYKLPAVCSSRAYISKYAGIGAGSVVMHDALINAGAFVGENCIINSKALVEHDVVIGSHCHISTGAIINGGVNVGSGTFLGSNAVCIQGTSIPKGSFVKAGHLERGV